MQGIRSPVGNGRGAAALPAVLLGLLLLAAFAAPLSGRLFYLRDLIQNHQPIRHVVIEQMRAGTLPLWDPYHGGGTPLLADPNNLVLHPISLLFLVLPFDAAFTASILLQYLLLACGGYLLARRLGAAREGATLTAIVLTLSGPAASIASMQNVLSAFAWVPLALWLWLRGLERGRRAFLGLAALATAVVLSTGEIASIVTLLLAAPLLGMTEDGDGRPSLSWHRLLDSLLWVGCGAALVAAVQILPARELLALSSRGVGFATGEGLKWSLQPIRLLELVVPRLFGDPTRLSPESWWGRWLFEGGYPFLLSVYIGVIPCLLAALSLLRDGGGMRRRRGLGVMALAGLLLALGSHGVLARNLFLHVPGAQHLRYPERFLLVSLLAIALLAGLGLTRLLAAPQHLRRETAVVLSAAVLVFLAMTAIVAAPQLADRLLVGGLDVPRSLMASASGAVLRGACLRAALWLFAESAALAAALLILQARLRTGPPIAGWGLAAVSGVSLLLATAPALSAAAPGWLNDPSPLADAVGHGPDAPRLCHDPRPADLSVWARTDQLIWGYRFDRFTYTLETGHTDRVPTLFDAATDRMDLRSSAALGRDLRSLSLEGRLRVLAIGHVGFLLSYQNLEHPDLEPGPVLATLSRPPARLYRLKTVLPRARFVARAVGPAFPGDAARSLADPRFEPRREVMLEGVPPGGLGGVQPAGSPEIPVRVVVDRPSRVVLQLTAPGPGWVVLADAMAPGWRARVDGKAAEMLRADELFRAVAVGAGAHRVEMSYRPTSVRTGLILTLLGLAGLGVWTVRAWMVGA
jgi:Bacterial membrane protein YfhO